MTEAAVRQQLTAAGVLDELCCALLEGRVGFEATTPGSKVRFLFGPHSAWLAESAGRVRARSARTNPPVLPA